MRKLLTLPLALILLASLALPARASESDPYTDMPVDDWAREAVLKAYEYGLMNGQGGGKFGTGQTITRQEFVTVLVRMFSLPDAPGGDAFDDIASSWARSAINSAAACDVMPPGGAFRPTEPITRREMAVMLIRALGLADIAEQGADIPHPFTDLDGDAGYIAVAYRVGMVNGTSPTTFTPGGSAKREQAAAMLVRVYERLFSTSSWSHAFYAISSYSQLDLAKNFDAVTLGWSRMTLRNSAPFLNTTTEHGNEYYIPQGHEGVITELTAAGAKLHLGVFMDNASGELNALMADPSLHDAAAQSIVSAAASLGLTGVTVDFEGLRAGSKPAFTAFLTTLDTALEAQSMTLYVTVMPATADGIYYDGYDYRAIGELADKVILMAHDYAPLSMESSLLGSEYYKNAALTPRSKVFYSLLAACDPETGVQDPSRLALNLSMTAMAWQTDENGKLTSTLPTCPAYSTVHSRLASGAQKGWSDLYGNPYATYRTEDGQNIFLWYEDERSVSDKLTLARLMGITSASIWRLGLIPAYPDENLNISPLLTTEGGSFLPSPSQRGGAGVRSYPAAARNSNQITSLAPFRRRLRPQACVGAQPPSGGS